MYPIKIFKFLGAICTFLILSDIAKQYDNTLFTVTLTVSFLYLVYRLVLVYYTIKVFINNVLTGKLLVRDTPIDYLAIALKIAVNASKNTVSFTVGVGVTYGLFYELDEILLLEGKEAYFAYGYKSVLLKAGIYYAAKSFLDKIGIKDRVSPQNVESITKSLRDLSSEDKVQFEKIFGVSWEEALKTQE